MPADELYLNDLRNIGEILVMQEPFDVFLNFFAQLFCSELLSLLVFFLEFLQP